MARPNITALPFRALREEIARGALSARDVAESFLKIVEEKEPEIRAFAHVDPEHVRHQAGRLDAHRAAGRPLGILHGVPVGLKDIIDTADMPTENGTPADKGRRPNRDAAIVSRLRAAGALIFGKTATTELAYFQPTTTANPHDPERTPGGSSSGSAAAVAAGMVPLAVGTQTTGSVIRPAAFCGVVGLKPTHGLVPRTGVLGQSRELDTVGAFARESEGAAALIDVCAGYDPGDADTAPAAAPRLADAAREEPPTTPLVAFVRSPAWDVAEESTKEAFGELKEALGDRCDEVELPSVFAEGAAAQRTLMLAGIAKSYGHYLDRHGDVLSETMREAIEKGRRITAVDYLAARDWREVLNEGLGRIFQRYDAVVTPATTGEAPLGLDTTGNPAFCALWTLVGTPALSLPLMQGPSGMPLGVQVVGRRGEDARLIRTARWLERALADDISGERLAS